MEKEKVKHIIAKNIQRYRKLNRLTQLELANKLNYSDKSISKWERGEGVPDIYVLVELANFFGLTVDDLLNENPPLVPINAKQKKHLMITLTAFASVWVVAVMFYAIATMVSAPFEAWPAFLIALPVSFIVLVVFTAIWSDYHYLLIPVSLFIWSLALVLTLFIPVDRSYLFFIIAIPVQILILFIFFVVRYRKKEKFYFQNQSNNENRPS